MVTWALRISVSPASTTTYVSETQMVCGSESEELVNQKVGQC